MKIYLAAKYARKDEIQLVATLLEQLGHKITATWFGEKYKPGVQMKQLRHDTHVKIAGRDLKEIAKADALVFFAEDQNNQPPRGGRHVEFGYALGLGKKVYVVGERENIFHHLPRVTMVPTVDELFKKLEK